MARFVCIDDEYINLDMIAKTVVYRTKDGWEKRKLLDINGKCLAETSGDTDLDFLTAPVSPAAPGTTAIGMWVMSRACNRPTELHIFNEIVVAWRIFLGDALPIFAVYHPRNTLWLMRTADGKLHNGAIGTFSNVEEATVKALRYFQTDWDLWNEQYNKHNLIDELTSQDAKPQEGQK